MTTAAPADARVRTVAAFDFDGTLSKRDNVVPFLRLVAGTGAVVRATAAAAPLFPQGLRDDAVRDQAKAVVLRMTLGGLHERHVRDVGERYARLVVARHLRPSMVAALEQHRRDGHHLVLVSASLTEYLEPIAALLDIPTVLATAMEVGPDGRLTGEIAGANVRAGEKVRRLDAWLGDEPSFVHAYGDSRGDDELLARADRATRIPRRDPTQPGQWRRGTERQPTTL